MTRTLASVVAVLERIAPLELAEDWDNVGLILEPSRATGHGVSRLLLCIDFDEAVLAEALDVGAQCVIAYHPPIFRGLLRLRASVPEERVLLRALQAGIAVYSPYTALDSTPNGVNDWLARGVGAGRSAPVKPYLSKAGAAFKLVVFVPRSHVAELRHALSRELGAGVIGNYSECSYQLEGQGSFLGNERAVPAVGARGRLEFVTETRLEMRCSGAAVKSLARVIAAHHPYEEPAWDLYPLLDTSAGSLSVKAGAGRLVELEVPASLAELVTRLKAHLGVDRLRVARAPRHASDATLSRIALCAGSGGSLFETVRDAELFVTGEMRHHDVLAKVNAGASVILAEHTHTERGFLPELAERILELTAGELEVLVSKRDAEPLCSV